MQALFMCTNIFLGNPKFGIWNLERQNAESQALFPLLVWRFSKNGSKETFGKFGKSLDC
jgi:hypothetical protein